MDYAESGTVRYFRPDSPEYAFRIDLERGPGGQHSPGQIVYIPNGGGAVICRQQLSCRQHEIVADRWVGVSVIVCCKRSVTYQVVEIGPIAGIANDGCIALIFFHHHEDVVALRCL